MRTRRNISACVLCRFNYWAAQTQLCDCGLVCVCAAPSTEPAGAPAPPTVGGTIREGMLFKTGGETKTWHQRWVVIAGPQLVYFKTQQDAKEVCVREGTRLALVWTCLTSV
jgi:hypothetical protein